MSGPMVESESWRQSPGIGIIRAFLVILMPSQVRETSLTQVICISRVWGLMSTGLVWVHLLEGG